MDFELIHLNIGLAKFPLDSEAMRSFWALEKPIYEVAHQSRGFVREIVFPDRFSVLPEPYIFNASAWASIEALKDFVYTGMHASALKDRKQWFKESPHPRYVLFWAPAGQEHTEASSAERVFTYAKQGPSENAFDFKTTYPKPVGESLETL